MGPMPPHMAAAQGMTYVPAPAAMQPAVAAAAAGGAPNSRPASWLLQLLECRAFLLSGPAAAILYTCTVVMSVVCCIHHLTVVECIVLCVTCSTLCVGTSCSRSLQPCSQRGPVSRWWRQQQQQGRRGLQGQPCCRRDRRRGAQRACRPQQPAAAATPAQQLLASRTAHGKRTCRQRPSHRAAHAQRSGDGRKRSCCCSSRSCCCRAS